MGKISKVALKETHKIKNKERMKKISQKALTEKGISVTGEKKRKRQLTGKESNVSIAIGLDTFQQSV